MQSRCKGRLCQDGPSSGLSMARPCRAPGSSGPRCWLLVSNYPTNRHIACTPCSQVDESQPSSSSSGWPQFQIRTCGPADAEAIGSICAEAFAFGNFPDLDGNELIEQIEFDYAESIRKEIAEKLRSALQKKQQVIRLKRQILSTNRNSVYSYVLVTEHCILMSLLPCQLSL